MLIHGTNKYVLCHFCEAPSVSVTINEGFFFPKNMDIVFFKDMDTVIMVVNLL